jgi:hypothetical protein
VSWRIRGTYFESCNCDAICPCRRIDGVPGGRSTHGICMGVLSWLIEEGVAGDIDLSGLPVAMAIRYSDDGRSGGGAEGHFPWTWKASELVAVRPVAIDVDHTRRRQRLRIRDCVSVRIRDRYDGEETVSCIIPGHDRAGEELVTNELAVDDDQLQFTYRGVCGYAATFDYAGS